MAELKGVEIFGEGTWNGNDITGDMLTNIVAAFNATKDFVKPVLKLGHNNSQELLQKDGLPAAGWVSNVYIRGKKLLADFIDIPDKIYELIKRKAYRKVSVEIFSGYSFDGKIYPNLLGAVALLGADLPAVMTLSDILDRYKLEAKNFTNDLNSNTIDIKIFTNDLEEPQMSEKKDGQDSRFEDLEGKLTTFQAQFDLEKKKNDDLEKKFTSYRDEAEKKISTLESQKTETEIEKFALNLEKKNLTSPSMLPYIKAILTVNRTDFAVGSDKLSTQDVIEKLLTLAKEVFAINKEETSQDLEPAEKDRISAAEKKIDEYMAANKVSYSIAYRAVMRKGD